MKQSRMRIIALIVLVVVTGAFCGFRLIDFQIVNGEQYLESASSNTVSEVKVNAARGKITDCNGEEIVTNKAGFNLVLDRAFLKEDTENDTALELTRILQQAGEDWIDDLPITQTQPYEFLDGKDTEIAQMKTKLGMQSYATAEECMNEIITKFKIEGYSQEDTRTIAGIRYGMFAKDFSIYNRYTFAEDISASTVATIKELSFRFPGVDVSQESIRDYGEGNVAPHIIGTYSAIFAGEEQNYLDKGYALNDLVGHGGIEGTYEDELRGSPGLLRIEQNSRGEVIFETEAVAPQAGNSVVLTIDKQFQTDVQNILTEYIEKLQHSGGLGHNVSAGALVVLDVKTGDVLALANYPTYSLTDGSASTKDRTLREIYRPGSTFKTVTATAGLMEGIIDEYSTVYCGGRYTFDDEYQPKCTGHHNNIAVVEALKMSCNIFFYDVGRRLGIDKINQYAHYLGLGVDTGLEIYNEDGRVANPDLVLSMGGTWNQGDVWQAAIGQGETKITPLQMAIQASTIANKGTRYAAHLVKSVDNYDLTETIYETQPEVLSDLSGHDEVFDLVQEGMREAANRRSSLVNISGGVAIKTGTPQLTATTTSSTTIGFYPALEEPEIAFSVVLEEGEYSADILPMVIEAYNNMKARQAGTAGSDVSSESAESSESVASQPEE